MATTGINLSDQTTDRGFGIAEVVIGMFLLGLIAIAVIPIAVQGLRQSVTNAAIAQATQLANQQIEQVRAQTSCAAVAGATTSVSAHGLTIQATRTVGGTCPLLQTGYPTTVPVTVSVKRTDTNAILASARTLVFVTGP